MQGDVYILIRINRNVAIAVIASVLVHALLLFFLSRQDLLNQHPPESAQRQTIVVRLNPRVPPVVEAAPPPSIPQPLPPRLAPVAKLKTPPTPHAEAPKVIATAKPEPTSVPQPASVTPSASTPPKPAALNPSQFPDMQAYMNAVREQRRLAGQDAARLNEEAAAQERARAENEARAAQPSPQPSGTNGIFQILSMDRQTAQIAFRGWKSEYSYSRREVYEVDAGLNGDVPRAVVRKMIEIIRRYYNGDFNWESQRLGRVVVLSARMQDNDGLEDFLLQDFFGLRVTPAR